MYHALIVICSVDSAAEVMTYCALIVICSVDIATELMTYRALIVICNTWLLVVSLSLLSEASSVGVNDLIRDKTSFLVHIRCKFNLLHLYIYMYLFIYLFICLLKWIVMK